MILYTDQLLEGIRHCFDFVQFAVWSIFTIITIITVSSHIYISVAAFSPTKYFLFSVKVISLATLTTMHILCMSISPSRQELQAKLDKEVHKWCNMPSKVTCIIKENCTLKQNLYLRFWPNISWSWCSVFCSAAVLLCVFWCILCFNLRNITSNLLVTNVVKCNFCFIRFATSFQINWTRNEIQQQHTYIHTFVTHSLRFRSLKASLTFFPSIAGLLLLWDLTFQSTHMKRYKR